MVRLPCVSNLYYKQSTNRDLSIQQWQFHTTKLLPLSANWDLGKFAPLSTTEGHMCRGERGKSMMLSGQNY